MKKKQLLLTVMLLLASVTGVYAEGEGALSITNVKNVVPGYTGSFDIVLNGSTKTYAGYQFTLTLPAGLTYDHYSNGELIHGHIATITGDAVKIFTGAANPTANFTAMNGTLLTIYFTVSGTASGTLDGCSLTTVRMSDENSNPSALADVNFSIEVGNTITLDENETPTFIDKENVNVIVNRTLKAGKWNTIVLPFDMTAAQIADDDAFGSSAVVAEFSGVTYTTSGWNVTGITFSFNTVSAIEANKPYLIKVGDNMSSFKAEGVNLPASASPSSVSFNDPVQGAMLNASFIGTYTPGFTIPENGLYISDNMFKYTQGTTKLKAFRAYIKPSMPLTDKTLSSSSRSISFTIDGETTGIYNVEDGTVEQGKYYNLKGQRVANPIKGVYVVNGKKVMFK